MFPFSIKTLGDILKLALVKKASAPKARYDRNIIASNTPNIGPIQMKERMLLDNNQK